MLRGIEPWQWAVVFLLVVLGVLMAVIAWRLASGAHSIESGILSGMGGGLITGFAVSLSVQFLTKSLETAQEEATWHASVTVASELYGFSPGKHSIEGISFNGKDMRDADFKGVDLSGFQFRDTVLRGADFTDANLTGTNFIGADLSKTVFKGATLQEALLLSSNLSRADLTGVRSMEGAQVNALTCWPAKFMSDPLMQQVRPMKVKDASGNFVVNSGKEYPSCVTAENP
ncbi:pentapeptide repeat-containing protein [Kitasatospora sp. NPDC057542]|uniref:pentapeptide repeat-containing protein n=1 Tax=Streptomycetaceae TaxID=2062 RepID=UPI001CCF99A2|nr:pentapeptide repeat-containing protein [Streptomyces sp. LS1784]